MFVDISELSSSANIDGCVRTRLGRLAYRHFLSELGNHLDETSCAVQLLSHEIHHTKLCHDGGPLSALRAYAQAACARREPVVESLALAQPPM